MQYSNLENEEAIEDKVGDHGATEVVVARIKGCKTANNSVGKKDSFWLIALVLTILLIGSVVFFVTHTGGTYRNLTSQPHRHHPPPHQLEVSL